MPLHPFAAAGGRLVEWTIDGVGPNLLGDPEARRVVAWCSPGTETGRWPLVTWLAGYSSSGLDQLSWRGFGESLPQRISRLIATDRMGPVVLLLPDGFTSLGGNQYVDSAATGAWATWLDARVLPVVEAELPVRGVGHRGILGKSSGGYGALMRGMHAPDVWSVIGCHSGDLGFEAVYGPHLLPTLTRLAAGLKRPLRTRDDLDAATRAFFDAWDAGPKVEGRDFEHLMTLAMAATWDPRPDAPRGARLPIDPWTGERDDDAWARWLAADPLTLVERPEIQANLAKLRGIWLDCGWRDQYAIHYGTRRLAARLAGLGLDLRHEEFDGDHLGTNHRIDVSLPWVYERLLG